MKTSCIIIQGPSNHVSLLKEKWGDSIQLIWSTWAGEESKYTNSDVVVFSTPPIDRGVHNLYMQSVSTLNGISKAKELGFKNVIKWRSDQYPTNPIEFVKLFDENNLTLLSGNNLGLSPYLIDYFMGGSIEDVELLWSFPHDNYRFPEEAITKQLISTELKNKVEYIHANLSKDNDVYWLGRNFSLTEMLSKDSGYNPTLFKN